MNDRSKFLRQPAEDRSLVIAIFRMCMIMHPAKTIIIYMCGYNQQNGRNKQPCLVICEKLFQNQETEAGKK
jgi:hypothetical protein